MNGPLFPGTEFPGQTFPGAEFPADPTPGDEYVITRTIAASGLAVDAAATVTVGSLEVGRRGEVTNVSVTPTAADFDFNIEYDGTDLFSAEQSPAAASQEDFTPDQNADFDGEVPEFSIDVSSASGTGGATADVTLTIRIEEQ